jgi:hypothetical protein
MSGYDLAEWAAFERSFGPIVQHERIDAAQAMLSSVVARVGRAKGDLRATRFLPQWGGPQAQTADEMVEALRRMARKSKRKPKEPHD